MTDLVTRLRALADSKYLADYTRSTCRKAADALDARTNQITALQERVKKLEAVAEAAHALKRNHKGIEGGWLFSLNNALTALEGS